jgi:hypothetical protein
MNLVTGIKVIVLKRFIEAFWKDWSYKESVAAWCERGD